MNKSFAALWIVWLPLAALPAVTGVPDAGTILPQVLPSALPTPGSSGTGLRIEPAGGATLPPSAPILVQRIQVTGNTLFDAPTLLALVADAQGKTLTLPQLGALAARITAYYQNRGYPLTRAIIPAQTITAGVVRIEVIEARYGRLSLDNAGQVNDALLQATLAPLHSGQAISQTEMDRALLLLSDIAGVAVDATLKPGDAVGTADLLVHIAPGSAISGTVVLDGYGNRYTGRERLGGTVNVNNPLNQGDVLSVSGLSSGKGLNYGRVAYESLVNGQDTRVGGAWSALNYALGDPLAALDAHGTAQVSSLWAKHPLVRSRGANLYAQLQVDTLQLRDHLGASNLKTDRTLDNWTLSLSGDARDTWLPGSTDSWSLGWTDGRIGFDDAAAQAADAVTAKTQGSFSKWTAALVHLQSVNTSDTLSLSVSGQWASTNLDSSQKMSVGGPTSVRAYDVGAVSGDRGYAFTAEYRRNLGQAWAGQWQVVAFVDSASVTVNQNPWSTDENSATLSGAGFGLNWNGPDQWHAAVSVATPIGPAPALVGTTSATRAWVELSRRF